VTRQDRKDQGKQKKFRKTRRPKLKNCYVKVLSQQPSSDSGEKSVWGESVLKKLGGRGCFFLIKITNKNQRKKRPRKKKLPHSWVSGRNVGRRLNGVGRIKPCPFHHSSTGEGANKKGARLSLVNQNRTASGGKRKAVERCFENP